MTSPVSNRIASSVDLANRLFVAFEAGDTEIMRSVCAEDMVACQNKGPSMDLDAQLAFCGLMHAVVQNFRYEDVRRQLTDTGFVSEHVVCGTLPNGITIRIPACVVGDISDGRIVRTVEYMDTDAAAPLIQAISAAIADRKADG